MSRTLIGNPLIAILTLFIISQLIIINSCSLTDLDYSLRRLTNSEGVISSDQGFHGPNSAKLSVSKIKSFSRIYIEFDDPLLLDDLDLLSMWILPLSGDGEVQIEIYLDDDEKILSTRKSLSDMESSQWNELDGFDLEYGDYGNLDDLKQSLGSRRIIKIWITLYKTEGEDDTIAFFDYIKIGDEIISFEPLEEEDIKEGSSSVAAGGLITYTITYGNNMLEPVDLVVREDYDLQTIFVYSYPPPDPGTVDTWTFLNLPPGKHGQITIKVRNIKPTAKARISGTVFGQGFSFVEGMLSTERKSTSVTNTVSITAGEFNFSQSVTTRIKPIIGSVLHYGEHGSGSYRAEEKLTYSQTSILLDRSIQTMRSPSRANLTNNRSLELNGDWWGVAKAENDYRDILWNDQYYEAEKLNLSYEARLGKSLTSLETAAQIEGLANRKSLWPQGFVETHLAGEFNLTGKVRWRWANKTVAPDKGWLVCCPPEQKNG